MFIELEVLIKKRKPKENCKKKELWDREERAIFHGFLGTSLIKEKTFGSSYY